VVVLARRGVGLIPIRLPFGLEAILAGRGVESDPSDLGEVGLDPRVGVHRPDRVGVRAGLLAGGVADDVPGRNPLRPEHHGHRSGEVLAVAFLHVEDELRGHVVAGGFRDVQRVVLGRLQPRLDARGGLVGRVGVAGEVVGELADPTVGVLGEVGVASLDFARIVPARGPEEVGVARRSVADSRVGRSGRHRVAGHERALVGDEQRVGRRLGDRVGPPDARERSRRLAEGDAVLDPLAPNPCTLDGAGVGPAVARPLPPRPGVTVVGTGPPVGGAGTPDPKVDLGVPGPEGVPVLGQRPADRGLVAGVERAEATASTAAAVHSTDIDVRRRDGGAERRLSESGTGDRGDDRARENEREDTAERQRGAESVARLFVVGQQR